MSDDSSPVVIDVSDINPDCCTGKSVLHLSILEALGAERSDGETGRTLGPKWQSFV